VKDTHTAELLEPVQTAVEVTRAALLFVSFAVILVIGGAQLERFLMKRKLSVLDGVSEEGNVEAGGGHCS
jgi:hypothetical protein